MSESVQSIFSYDIHTVNHSVRQTNALLRSINAIRLSVDDMRDLAKRPNITKFFWTAIQLMRTYTALKRLLRLISTEISDFIPTPGIGGGGIPPIEFPTTPLTDIRVHVDAFLLNMPIKIEQIDLSNLDADTEKVIRDILERDAPLTVDDARRLLNERILHPERSTRLLESRIFWTPDVGGTRIVADTFYAWWVEKGQRSFLGHHFMEDATTLSRERIFYALQERLDELILGREET